MKKCFGQAIAKTDIIHSAQDVIERFCARKKCVDCRDGYNCLMLSTASEGFEGKEIDDFLMQVKKRTLVLKFNDIIREKAQFAGKAPENCAECSKQMSELFFEEIMKDENEEVRDVMVEGMRNQFEFMKMALEGLRQTLERLGESFDEF